MKIAFIITRKRNNAVVSFGTLKVKCFMLTEVRDCDLLLVVTSSTFLKTKDILKEKRQLAQIIKACSPAYIWTNVLCTPVRSTCILHFSRSGFFRLSRCPCHTWAHIKYPSSLCICTRVYKHTHTSHLNTCKNRKKYTRQNPYLYLCQNTVSHARNKR